MAGDGKTYIFADHIRGITIGLSIALAAAAAVWLFLGGVSSKDGPPAAAPSESFSYVSLWAEYPTELPPPHDLAEVGETNNNGSMDGATPVAMFQRATGNLSTRDDVDFYSFTIDIPANVKFSFSFDGSDDGYTYLWEAAVYGPDGSTVLNGTIPSKEGEEVTFTASELTPGTYFLKISRASGYNPFMNGYSDTNYHIALLPECTEHVSVTQVLTAMPTCSQAGELTPVCNICDMVLNPEPLEPVDHIWSAWKAEEEVSFSSPLGKRSRTCVVGGESETDTLLFYILDAGERNMIGILIGVIAFLIAAAVFRL